MDRLPQPHRSENCSPKWDHLLPRVALLTYDFSGGVVRSNGSHGPNALHTQKVTMIALRAMVTAAAGIVIAGITGCTALSVNSPVFVERLKVVSAGHTGCQPAENQISSISDALDGVTWNATCKGRVYLCSGASPRGAGDTYSCASVAQ